MMRRQGHSRSRGMSFVEVLMASIIIGTLLVSSLRVIGAARASQLKLADQGRARLLAQQLMAEVMSQAFEEAGTEGTFGLMSTHDAWTRSVAVDSVTANDLTLTTGSDTGIKRIVVTVKRGDVTLATSTAVRTREGSPPAPLTVSPGDNSAPTAVNYANAGLASLNPTYEVEFSATGSSDPDGDSLIYHWDVGDGTIYSVAEFTHTYPGDGSYTATLTVSDGKGGVDTDTVIIWFSS